MPIKDEEIKKALDDFESDDFISAKERIKGEINGAVSDFFKEKLSLQKDLEPKTEVETEVEVETDDKGGSEE